MVRVLRGEERERRRWELADEAAVRTAATLRCHRYVRHATNLACPTPTLAPAAVFCARSGRGVDNPESKSDAGGVGGADMLEVLALKKQVKQLKDEVAAAREKVAKGEARQTKLTAKLDEARRSLAKGGGGAANGASGGGASSEELADALDAAQAAQADAKKLGKKLANTEEERATAARELKAAKSSAEDLQRRVDSLTAQLQSVSSGGDAAAAASAAASQQVDALKAEREALERRVQALEEEVSAARDAADEAAAGQAKAEKALVCASCNVGTPKSPPPCRQTVVCWLTHVWSLYICTFRARHKHACQRRRPRLRRCSSKRRLRWARWRRCVPATPSSTPSRSR